jgi:hypothetical protein
MYGEWLGCRSQPLARELARPRITRRFLDHPEAGLTGMRHAADRTTRDHLGRSLPDRLFMPNAALVSSVPCYPSSGTEGRRPTHLAPTFNDMDKTSKPKHVRHFNHAEAELIWAAVMTLDEPAKHEVYEHLADHLVVGRGRTRRHSERRDASVAALREAAEILGRSPSIRDYRGLMHDHPEYGWPNDGAIRRWFGNCSWNEALAEAGLARVADGDFVGASAGYQFEFDELVAAVKVCGEETGYSVPPQNVYLGWAARRETHQKHDRIPRSLHPFDRFGGYRDVVIRGGLMPEDGVIVYPNGTIMPNKHGYTDDDMLEALREVAERLSHSPLTREYGVERDKIRKESADAGAPRTLPAWGVIRTRFGRWDAALVAAGLKPTNGRVTGVRRRDYQRKGGVRFSDDVLYIWMRRAFDELGGPANTTTLKYKPWRLRLLAEAEARGEYLKIPGYEAYHARFKTWDAAKHAALNAAADGKERAAEHNRDTSEAEAA